MKISQWAHENLCSFREKDLDPPFATLNLDATFVILHKWMPLLSEHVFAILRVSTWRYWYIYFYFHIYNWLLQVRKWSGEKFFQVREQLGNVILGVGFFGLLLGKHLILRGTDPLKLIFDPENLQVGLQCTHTSWDTLSLKKIEVTSKPFVKWDSWILWLFTIVQPVRRVFVTHNCLLFITLGHSSGWTRGEETLSSCAVTRGMYQIFLWHSDYMLWLACERVLYS